MRYWSLYLLTILFRFISTAPANALSDLLKFALRIEQNFSIYKAPATTSQLWYNMYIIDSGEDSLQ